MRKKNLCGRIIGLALGAAFVPASLFGAQDAARRSVRIIRNGDSSFVKVTVAGDELERMIRELVASRALEQTIAQSLRDASSGQSDGRKMRELSDRLAAIAQKNSQLITNIEMTCAGDRQPPGYIGVQFDVLQTMSGDIIAPTGQLVDYPKIDMVYPDSPASRAGIHRGDVVLLLGDQDTRRPVPLDKILKPGSKLPVRILRDGVSKELTVTIEKRPNDFNSDCANVDSVIGPELDAPVIFMRSAPRAAAGALPWLRAPNAPETPPAAPAPPGVPKPAMAPMAPMAPMVGAFAYGFTSASNLIFGAALQGLDDDWRAALGVDNGVLVTKVLDGSPAKDSGLHSGDVIVSVDGETISSVRALSRIVSNSESKSLKLGIIRASKPQSVTLRWGPK